MPGPAEILENSRRIASEAFALAVFWHAWIAAGALAVSRGKASEQRAGQMLSVMTASVSGVAFAFHSPFNGVVFAALALVLAATTRRMSLRLVQAGPAWSVAAGLVLMALGWTYPEFVDKPGAFLYGAPLGLLPCPTLSMLIGATLLFGGLGSRAWSLTLAGVGLFYGLFGALRLGVRLDVILALGAAALASLSLLSIKAPTPPPRRALRPR